MPKSDLLCCVDSDIAELPKELLHALTAAGIAVVDSAAGQGTSEQLYRTGSWRLHYSADGLAVSHLHKSHLQNIRVDFNPASARFSSSRKVAHELLIKAVGGVAPPGRTIIDATAGLGIDSLLLCKAGHQVRMFERSAVVALLLQDAVLRAPELKDSLSLIEGDAVPALTALSSAEKPDLVYLDPMFPTTGKRARARKGLEALKELLPESATQQPGSAEQALLEAALDGAKYRVIVKRPLRAAPLPGPAPGFNYSGKLIRYDCYALQKMPAA